MDRLALITILTLVPGVVAAIVIDASLPNIFQKHTIKYIAYTLVLSIAIYVTLQLLLNIWQISTFFTLIYHINSHVFILVPPPLVPLIFFNTLPCAIDPRLASCSANLQISKLGVWTIIEDKPTIYWYEIFGGISIAFPLALLIVYIINKNYIPKFISKPGISKKSVGQRISQFIRRR